MQDNKNAFKDLLRKNKIVTERTATLGSLFIKRENLKIKSIPLASIKKEKTTT